MSGYSKSKKARYATRSLAKDLKRLKKARSRAIRRVPIGMEEVAVRMTKKHD